MPNAAYDRLKARFARIAALGEAAAMLHWDAAAMMPPGGGAARGEQLAALAGLSHELLTAPVVAEDLEIAPRRGRVGGRQPRPDAPRPCPRHRPADRPGGSHRPRQFGLREDLARGQGAAPTSPWSRPALTEVVRLQRETAQALAAALGHGPL